MTWIDASIKLPAIGEKVLVVYEGEVQWVTYYRDAGDVGEWWECSDGSDTTIDMGCVTHWMPLPAPPTAEEMGSAGLHPTTGQGMPAGEAK